MPGDSLFSHLTIGTNDLERAKAFYQAVLEPLGGVEVLREETGVGFGFGSDGQPEFWVVMPFDNAPATAGNGVHIAFNAPSRAAVDAFHALALARGGTDEGMPGLRPHYHDDYYGAYVRDLDGNKLQAVCHLPE